MFDPARQRVSVYVLRDPCGHTDGVILRCAAYFVESSGEIAPDVSSWRVERDERGKPRIISDCGICASVSHSGGYTVCAVSNGEVGIDLQYHSYLYRPNGEGVTRLESIAKRYFDPAETEWVKKEPERRFFTVWSAKESYVKYTGSGIDDSFGDFSVIPAGGPTGTAWSSSGVSFTMLPFEPDFSLCVCTRDRSDIETEYI